MKAIDWTTAKVFGIDPTDNEHCNAYIDAMQFTTGEALTPEELEQVNEHTCAQWWEAVEQAAINQTR